MDTRIKLTSFGPWFQQKHKIINIFALIDSIKMVKLVLKRQQKMQYCFIKFSSNCHFFSIWPRNFKIQKNYNKSKLIKSFKNFCFFLSAFSTDAFNYQLLNIIHTNDARAKEVKCFNKKVCILKIAHWKQRPAET